MIVTTLLLNITVAYFRNVVIVFCCNTYLSTVTEFGMSLITSLSMWKDITQYLVVTGILHMMRICKTTKTMAISKSPLT